MSAEFELRRWLTFTLVRVREVPRVTASRRPGRRSAMEEALAAATELVRIEAANSMREFTRTCRQTAWLDVSVAFSSLAEPVLDRVDDVVPDVGREVEAGK